jgi:ketosteroid isomerase-like protein
MTELERHLAEAACARLIAEYANAVDHYDHAAALAVFTQDGVYEPPTGALNGKDEIRAYFERRDRTPRGLHVCTNVLIRVTDASNAVGTHLVTYYCDQRPQAGAASPLSPPLIITRVHDRFALERGAWRIAERRVEPLFKAR